MLNSSSVFAKDAGLFGKVSGKQPDGVELVNPY
jgi:hypothetical protein